MGAIDCTVFPVLLTLLPILNMGSSGKYEVMLHAISHKVALYFVAPVGGAAVATTFLQHAIDHLLHEWHSVINVMGCFTLLSSQWYAHRLLHKMGKDCGHNHGSSANCASDLLKP